MIFMRNNITNFVILNGFLDILNALSQFLFCISWYNFVLTDISTDFLYFVMLYGIVRVYEGVLDKGLYLSTATYILEVFYFYEVDINTSIICLLIALLLIFMN